MKGPPRLIYVDCPCGLTRKLTIAGGAVTDDKARRIFEDQCPVCGNTGAGRVYTIVAPHHLRLIKNDRKQN